MADSSFVQASFLGGEWSPFAQGRSDLPSYRTALNVCRNAFPMEEGAWIRRSGTKFPATTLNGGAGKLIKFDFEQTAPYILEFTDGALRMLAAAAQTQGLTNGAPLDFRLVTTNDNQQIAGVSTANPAVVQTNAAHGWATGDQVQFYFDGSVSPAFMPLLRNRVFAVTVTDSTHFSITDPITGATIDGSTLGYAAGSLFVAARILNKTTVYTAGAWSTLRAVQAETESFLLHGSYLPYALNVTALPTASAFAAFSLAAASFTDGPYLDPPIDGSTLTPSAKTGSINLTASALGSINGGSGFVATDIGRLVRLLSEPPAWKVGTAYVVGNSVSFGGTYFTCTANNTGQQPDISVADWSINTAAATWSWAKITAITSTSIAVATVKGVDLLYTGAINTWRLGAYSDTTGYPTCGVYYEGRLWLSGAIANRVDASMVNAISGGAINMTPTAADGTVADNNAIAYTFNASDVNPIYWMVGVDAGIVCGTQAGEWLIRASQLSDPITPTSIQAHRGTTYGCANIEPQHAELTICFVHRYGRKVLEYFPDVFSGKYNAPNLSKAAQHLTVPHIKEIRYQQELLPVVWARCGDGSLIGVTYQRASLFSTQAAESAGWHRHDLGSGRVVESICTGPSVDGTLDTLAMVTNDPATGIRHVELMQSMFEVNADIKDGWFCDDAVTPSGGVISGTTLTLNGLWHLNGKTVTALVGGLDAGDYTVANGSIGVAIDADPLNPDKLSSAYLTSITSASAYGARAMPVLKGSVVLTVPCVVGFSYTSQGQILRPDTVDQTKSPTGPALAKPRRIHQFGALLQGTQGISFGTSFSKLRALQLKSPGGKAYTALQLFSGVVWETLDSTYDFDNMLCWQVSRPYPAAVASVSGFMNTSER